MDSIRSYQCSAKDLSIDINELFLQMGYCGSVPSGHINERIEDAVFEIEEYCQPTYGYLLTRGEIITNASIRISNMEFSTGRIITKALAGASHFAIFTASLGASFDLWKKTKKNDMLDEYIADSLGSILAENLVKKCRNQIKFAVSDSAYKITNSYSPGYCDWKLTEQKKIFSLLPDTFCGIRLTESCLMLPIKSVSGIIGVGSNVVFNDNSCNLCSMMHCLRKKS